jgi:hypothetical protein
VTAPASSPRNDKPTLPPDSCPVDSRLTEYCRRVVRDRKSKEAARELAKAVIARMYLEGQFE